MADFVERGATVLASEPGELLVRVDQEEADCGGCACCAVRGLCRGRDAGHFDVRVAVPDGRADKPGDRVTVAYRGANPAVASLVMFLPSLIGVVFGGFVANAVFKPGDSIFLLGALAGLAIGVGLTFLLARMPSLRPEVRLAEA